MWRRLISSSTSQFHQVQDEDADPDYEPFFLESTAYSYLTYYGICDEGIVSQCYGSYDFPGWKFCDQMSGRSDIESDGDESDDEMDPLHTVRNDTLPPKALLLEISPGAELLSIDNITPQKADRIVYTDQRVHDAYVLHNDLYPRNILCLPDRRVVLVGSQSLRWSSVSTLTSISQIDFNTAWTYPNDLVTKRTFHDEMKFIWALLFHEIVCCLMTYNGLIAHLSSVPLENSC
jgi:hypothetical protein